MTAFKFTSEATDSVIPIQQPTCPLNNDATPWVHRDRYLAIFQTSSIRGLETLGVMTESYGSLLIPILLKKIPEDIRCLIFRADPLADSSLDRLRVAIRQEIET